MSGHAEKCVERYLELSGKTAKDLLKCDTPCVDDHQLTTEDQSVKGELSSVAARIVLKVLYLSRMGRPETLWSVNTLARQVTKWSAACDRRMHRLASYLNRTKNWCQLCYVGDYPDDCWIACFCDASLQEICKPQHPLLGHIFAWWDLELLSHSPGCARNRVPLVTVQLKQKSLHLMLLCVWRAFQFCPCGKLF